MKRGEPVRVSWRLAPRSTLVPAALGAGVLILALASVAAWNVAIAAPAVALWLEDATGETEFFPQMQNLAVLTLRQRPVETADLTPVTHTGMVPYGVNAFFEQEVEEAKLRRSMEMMRQAGIRWVRQQIPWERIEPEAKGQFTNAYGPSWSQFDDIVTLAHEYGLELVVRPDLPPAWARSNPNVPASRPRDLADYGDFLEALARRYQGKLRYYQIWNEPNLYGEWGAPPDAAGYAEMLRMAHGRLKAVDPEIVILSAPLSPTTGTPDGLNESDLTYLQKLYDLGAGQHFDILSAQGYGLWTGPGDRRTEPGQVNFSRVRLLREIMVRNGDAGKSVWISEMGWNALPPDYPGPATHGRVTLEQQARSTVAGLERIQAEWPWVGVTFLWHFRRVSDADRNQVMFYYRMADPDFTPLPVYDAVKRLATGEPVMRLGAHQEDHWALTYSPGWTVRRQAGAGFGAFRSPNSAGSAVEWLAEGGDVTATVAASPSGGRFYVTVDGAAANGDLERDDWGRATLTAVAEAPAVRRVLLARLAPGVHRVRLQAEQGGADWGLDAVTVSPPASFPWWVLPVMPLAAVGALALGITLGRRPRPGARGPRPLR